MRYGDDKTWHRTGEVNVERDRVTGKVVSVWFRCRTLRFTDTEVEQHRATDMREIYHSHPPPALKAVDFEDS